MALAVAGPYMAACTLAYGDPFYAVNFHTKFYRSRSGLEYDTPMSWAGYLRTGFVTGLTTYPFTNKWQGLDWLTPWLRRLLAPAAVAGLLIFTRSPAGRLLLVILFSALLPYAFTWGVPGGAEWRFTMHAYPFYLVAAMLALDRAAALLRGGGHPRRPPQPALHRHQEELVQHQAREAGAAAPADAPPLAELGGEREPARLRDGVVAGDGLQQHRRVAVRHASQGVEHRPRRATGSRIGSPPAPCAGTSPSLPRSAACRPANAPARTRRGGGRRWSAAG